MCVYHCDSRMSTFMYLTGIIVGLNSKLFVLKGRIKIIFNRKIYLSVNYFCV